jgi:hypothetical protein
MPMEEGQLHKHKYWAESRRQLAIDRSNQDALQSNEHLRAAAQATILINGGAATAVLAFLSALIAKDKADAHLFTSAGLALIAYTVGVACAPLVIWFMNIALKHWNQSWQRVLENPGSDVVGTKEHEWALPWYWGANICFGISILGFVAGSGILAGGFLFAPASIATSVPSQSSTTTPDPSATTFAPP